MKNFLLAVCLLLSLTGWAQSPTTNSWIEPGQLQIGLGASAGYGNRIGGYLRATPYAKYFIRKGWAIGAEGRYNYNGPDGNQYVGAGLFTQYHFLRTSTFSLFGQAGYYYG
ncbi:hypothetical protein DYU11_26125 [Fibrisoma montanum]|uniref:Outer membrane protein beta-barrel domain-containing protein n=1 Tax=Fibrisoma montanum TaxID=2305895 RepID=A0A418M0F7_9BACT|nr:hypothetical protein [Fibrisoma montanum]RIV18979.1 hypothetical protein DYU11_26125 [Fibrisoma montanum]